MIPGLYWSAMHPRPGRFIAVLLVAIVATSCDGNSPTAPSTPATSPTAPSTPATSRIIALDGNLAFGSVEVGATKELSFTITNTGNAQLTVTGITGPSGHTPNWTTGTVAAGGVQTVTVRFTPTAEQPYDGTLTVNGDQTSGTNTIRVSGTGTGPPRRGSVSDPTGDAFRFGPLPQLITGDLVGATIEVSGGTLTVTVSFAPGTLSQANIYCTVYLDTDENPATGSPGISGGGVDAALMGVDYFITFVSPRNSSRATIGAGSGQGGTADVTFPSADQARIAFPLSLLGNDDGRLAFKVGVSQWIDDGGQTFIAGQFDIMPNVGVSPGRTR